MGALPRPQLPARPPLGSLAELLPPGLGFQLPQPLPGLAPLLPLLPSPLRGLAAQLPGLAAQLPGLPGLPGLSGISSGLSSLLSGLGGLPGLQQLPLLPLPLPLALPLLLLSLLWGLRRLPSWPFPAFLPPLPRLAEPLWRLLSGLGDLLPNFGGPQAMAPAGDPPRPGGAPVPVAPAAAPAAPAEEAQEDSGAAPAAPEPAPVVPAVAAPAVALDWPQLVHRFIMPQLRILIDGGANSHTIYQLALDEAEYARSVQDQWGLLLLGAVDPPELSEGHWLLQHYG